MVSHKEFGNAGKQPGLQVWRIENLDLKPVPKNLHGCFYTGDAYLLLYTTSAPSYSIHMWLGKRSVVKSMLLHFFKTGRDSLCISKKQSLEVSCCFYIYALFFWHFMPHVIV